nr:immunoglobulin heavy chain junction region [Macaca mulatta]MOV49385.1 immunoglobulin heavy chain junction region [Macaca mulatta]MOV50024.1 immunoglobulin heavy chain junction region [Macaca mulatta]MOV50433.1 immunoglobulin heavy chain junction region [Macaca mulatta]MOV50698.1 immunoglobulin heavy chain junction region [Macaca mulatta]
CARWAAANFDYW